MLSSRLTLVSSATSDRMEGVCLQGVDSDIAEEVALHFANQGKACLIVHDSFVVKASDEDELRETMTEAYRKRFGYSPLIH